MGGHSARSVVRRDGPVMRAARQRPMATHGRPKGRFSRLLGASARLDDAPHRRRGTSCPKNAKRRSHVPSYCDRGYLRTRCAVMLEHHKWRATPPGAAGASTAYRSRGDTPRSPPTYGVAEAPPAYGAGGTPPHMVSGEYLPHTAHPAGRFMICLNLLILIPESGCAVVRQQGHPCNAGLHLLLTFLRAAEAIGRGKAPSKSRFHAPMRWNTDGFQIYFVLLFYSYPIRGMRRPSAWSIMPP